MKKVILAMAAAAAFLSSTPVLAQSANDAMRYDEAHDPAYRAAVLSRYNGYGYGAYSGYGYGAPVVATGDTTCILGLFCSSHGPRNHAGDICYDANGVAYGLDKELRWYALPGSTPDPMRANDRSMRCGFTGAYHASAPAEVAVVVPTPPATAPGVFVFRDGNYLVTVTTYANGTQKVSKQYSPQ